MGIYMPDFDSFFVRPSNTSAPGAFQFTAEGHLAEPDGSGGFANSPYLYNVRFTQDGRVPAELVKRVTDRELAVVHSTHAASAPGKIGVRENVVSAMLPFTLTEYYTPDQPWTGSFMQIADPDTFLPETFTDTAMPRTFSLGRTTVEHWNAAVFGPAFPANPYDPAYWAGRLGDQLGASIPLFSDQDPNHFVKHPANAEFVSLKATARDTDGNAVDQTIIRAYALK